MLGWQGNPLMNKGIETIGCKMAKLVLYDETVDSRLLLGTANYPSPEILAQAVKVSGTGMVTVSLRRELGGNNTVDGGGRRFWRLIRELNVRILPNTAGCKTVAAAVATARMARELFDTSWIKLEVIGEDDTLQPDVIALVEAARILTDEGFCVFPYTTEDLVVAEHLLASGCRVLMPWGSPIGSARGLNNLYGLKTLRNHFKDVPLIIDAGIGAPSHALMAMELGFDGVLVNTAVAKATDSVLMAEAFALAVSSGVLAQNAGIIQPRDMAMASTPTTGVPFWHNS